MNRLKDWCDNVISLDMIYKSNLTNIHDCGRLSNVVLKTTINSSILQPKDVIFGLVLLELLSNQKAKLLRTKKSVAAFKTKKHAPISCQVIVRKTSLYEFLDLFVCVFLPKLPQIRELNKNLIVQSKNALSLGLTNLAIFPQLSKEFDHIPRDIGITITINFDSLENDSQLLCLLSQIQFPTIS